MDIVTALKETPIPNILVGGGILFLLLAVAGQIAGKIEIKPERQKWSAIIGTLLLIGGVLLHVLPLAPSSPATASTSQSPASLPLAASLPPPAPGSGLAIPTSVPQSANNSTGDCFAQYFSDVPADRVATIETGSSGFPIITASQSKDGLIGIKFTDFNIPIGGMKYFYFPETAVFKVIAVVDAQCQAIDNYINHTSGGDKRVVQNWDTLRIQFGDRTYAVQLGDGGSDLRVSVGHVSN